MAAAGGGLIGADQAVELAAARPGLRLIGIDGRPLAGKSTLAERMARRLDAGILRFDDFVRPQAEWPSRNRPSYPFAYMRHGEFAAAVKDLARTGRCAYRPWDWETLEVSDRERVFTLERPVIVEGVTALQPQLAPLYDLSVWVESDAATTMAASLTRGVGPLGNRMARDVRAERRSLLRHRPAFAGRRYRFREGPRKLTHFGNLSLGLWGQTSGL